MFYKLLNYLNTVSFIPYYFVTPLVYGYGTAADQILLSICKKDKNKKLIILYPSVFKSFFKYNIPNKYLLDNLIIQNIPQKNFKYFKFILGIFLNMEFILRRLILYIFEKLDFELNEQFRFPLVGVIPIFVNDKSYEEKKIDTNINFDVDLEEKENIESKIFLASIGILENDKFVCLHVRDDVYYNDPKRRLYRNSNIENYTTLIKYLIENNYYVIRLGLKNKEFNFKDKKFIDYSSFPKKKDFIELYLIKNCSFFVGTQSGPLSIATLFNKPIFFTNAVRIFESFFPLNNNKNVTIFKTVKWKKNNKKISLKKFIEMPAIYHHYRFIDDDSFIYEENTPEELYVSLVEFMNNLEKKDYKISDIQEKFNNLVKSEYMKKNLIFNKKDYMDEFYYYKTRCLLENSKGSYCSLFLGKNFNG